MHKMIAATLLVSASVTNTTAIARKCLLYAKKRVICVPPLWPKKGRPECRVDNYASASARSISTND